MFALVMVRRLQSAAVGPQARPFGPPATQQTAGAVLALMNTLGFVALRPDNGAMEIKSDNPDHGFQFPGQFELSAMARPTAAWSMSFPACCWPPASMW